MTDGVQSWLRHLGLAAAALLVAASASVQAQASGPWPARGELLYKTHCIACHTEQMHWRDKKLAYDWATLKAQVARWQNTAKLEWSDADVVDVSRYLNETIYRYPQTSNQVSVVTQPAGAQ
jgi:mono/diheme cytochrome c family protein